MRIVVVAAVACLFSLSACGDSPVGGNAEAPRDDTAKPAAGTKGTPLAGTDPCTLLKPADVPDLTKDTTFKPKKVSGEHPTCAGYDFAVTIIDNDRDARDLAFRSAGTDPIPDIDGHEAVMRKVDTGALQNCSISMDVTDDEFVRIQITHGDDPAKACDIAKEAAAVVASRIPA